MSLQHMFLLVIIVYNNYYNLEQRKRARPNSYCFMFDVRYA